MPAPELPGTFADPPELPGTPGTPRNSPELPGTPRNSPELFGGLRFFLPISARERYLRWCHGLRASFWTVLAQKFKNLKKSALRAPIWRFCGGQGVLGGACLHMFFFFFFLALWAHEAVLLRAAPAPLAV